MKKRIFFILGILLFNTLLLQAAKPADFLYGRHPQLTVTITPDTPEIYAGDMATFTVQIKNRSDKTYNLGYATGQQWDLAVYHEGLQIFRWSEGLQWSDRHYSVPLKKGETKSGKIAWRSTDRLGTPLPQGVYAIRGMATIAPKPLVTEDCNIRILPPKVGALETIKAKINMLFDIELPRYTGTHEIKWNIKYKYNDNRIDVHKVVKAADKMFVTFHPKRYGHVEFDLYGHPEMKSDAEGVERRSYRIEIGDNL